MPTAAEELLPVLYRELRQIARRHLAGERDGHTLQPTALVNEAFVRPAGPRRAGWENREHFLAVAAQVMRGFWSTTPAGALNVSPATIQRDWRMARAWLRRDLTR